MDFLDVVGKLTLLAIVVVVVYVFTNSDSQSIDARLDTLKSIGSSQSMSLSVLNTSDRVTENNSAELITSGGGGGGGDSRVVVPRVRDASGLPLIYVPQRIIDLKLCQDQVECKNTNPWPGDYVIVYWRVENGQGCCNTFLCNYEEFKSLCLEPFKLYDIYLDGVKQNIDATKIDYTCSANTPWNFYTLTNLTLGDHSIDVLQKDCSEIVDRQTITFNLQNVNGSYIIGGI